MPYSKIWSFTTKQGSSSERGGAPFSPKNSGGALIAFYPCPAEKMGGPGLLGPLDDYIHAKEYIFHLALEMIWTRQEGVTINFN